MCKECKEMKRRIIATRELFETYKDVSSYEYKRGFINAQVGLLKDDPSNK